MNKFSEVFKNVKRKTHKKQNLYMSIMHNCPVIHHFNCRLFLYKNYTDNGRFKENFCSDYYVSLCKP